MPIETSVIILNYKTSGHVDKLLQSLKTYVNHDLTEIIVADNDSNDSYLKVLEEKFGFVKFIYNNSNGGFAYGNNKAVWQAQGEFLLFVNPDIVFKDDSILLLTEYMKSNPNCGIVSGLLEDDKGNVIYCFNDYPGFLWEFYQMVGYGYDRKIDKLIKNPLIAHGKNFEVDWFHGALILIRKDDFISIGGFNENYFMYYEDVELCFKVRRKLGKSIMCIPKVRVIHDTRASIKNIGNDDIYTFHINRSKLIFFRNYKLLKSLALRLISFTGVLLRFAVLPVWRKYSGIRLKKFRQMTKVAKLYVSKGFLDKSIYEYTR